MTFSNKIVDNSMNGITATDKMDLKETKETIICLK